MKKQLSIVLVLIYFLSIALLNSVFAQKQMKIDSILHNLKTANDSNQVKLYQELYFLYLPEKFDKAYQAVKKSIEICIKKKYLKGEARGYDLLGSLYVQSGDFATGLEYKFKMLKIYEKYGDEKGITSACNNIGVIYFRKGDYKLALKYYQQAHKLSIKHKDLKGQAIHTLNIGEVHQMLGNFDKAIEYEKKTLELSEKNSDNLAYAYGIIGKVYEDKKEFEKAIIFYRKAILIFKQLQVFDALTEYYFYLARTYLKKQEIQKALELAIISLQIAQKYQEKLWVKQNYELLADIYAQNKKFDEAYLYQKKYTILRDSIVNSEREIKTARLQTIYESEKNQAQIEILKRDKALKDDKIAFQNLILIIALLVIISVIVLLFLLFRNNQQKKKANKILLQKNEEINLQKEEILAQRDNLEILNQEILTQKEEIEKINTDIISSISYAMHIQTAMLPPQQEIFTTLPKHFIYFKPRDIVSGDFYWFHHFDKENKTILAAVDCTGHGVPGAFMSMLSNQLLYDVIITQQVKQPNLVLNQLRIEIRRALNQTLSQARDGMDIALVCIDHNEKKLQFAGAGNPLIYFQNNELFEIKGDPSTIGGNAKSYEKDFTLHTLDIQLPTTFYLFSDGFQDQFGGERGRKFMHKRFKETLQHLHQENIETQLSILDNTFIEWTTAYEKQKQIDDILVIGVQL
jgi:tetratricopeptide (TPR) repeat protein